MTETLTENSEFKTQSETIGKIALALSKAQAKMQAAKRTATNPFFNSNYADLNAVWDAIRSPLSEQELAVVQTPVEDNHGTAIITTLTHSSGEWFRSMLYIAPKAKDAQSVGSAITYARRYALSAITGIAPDDDDDGERAVRPEAMKTKTMPPAALPAAPPVQPEEVMNTHQINNEISEIHDMLAKMNAGDEALMNTQLHQLTKWTPKGTTEEKFLRLEDLPRIAKNKPSWFKGVLSKVKTEYQKAFDANGNPK